MSATLGEALEGAIGSLSAAGIGTPRIDAEVLLEHCTGFERARFATDPGLPMPRGSSREFAAFVRRRLAREPVAYITGTKGFRRIELECDRRALIPRPETELLVDVSVAARPRRVLDVGTGTGAVGLAIADELPECELVATDSSPAALALARHNAQRLGLGDRVSFAEGSVPADSFDLVVANLPYVREEEWTGLQPEITDWEPREALLAGPEGLDAIHAVCGQIGPPESGARCETPRIALEIGAGQGESVAAILRARGFGETQSHADLSGIERVLVGRAAR